jgi:hypothetical protein
MVVMPAPWDIPHHLKNWHGALRSAGGALRAGGRLASGVSPLRGVAGFRSEGRLGFFEAFWADLVTPQPP